jgi:hypothetical protein
MSICTTNVIRTSRPGAAQRADEALIDAPEERERPPPHIDAVKLTGVRLRRQPANRGRRDNFANCC